jgi:hypothetical protein
MASNTYWPDGTPRRSPNDNGSVGGLKDGRALRHTPETEPATENMGWLNNTGAAVSNPQGTPYTKIGPGTPVWDRGAKPFKTGDQRKR